MIISAQHKINIPVGKILVIQLGDIGNVVWAIPAFWTLKDAFQQSGLLVLVRNSNGDLLLDDPHIDKIFQVGQQSLFAGLRLLKNLRRGKFDLLFDLRADDCGAFISFLSGAKIRAALYYRRLFWRNRTFTHLVDPPSAKERILGAAEQSLKIIRGFAIKKTTSAPQICVAEKLKDKLSRLLTEEEIETKHGWVSINPFSHWSYKEWDMDKWRQLASFIWKKYKMPVINTGSIAEESGLTH